MAARRAGANCKVKFDELTIAKMHRFVIYDIRLDLQIDVKKVGNRDAEYEDFLEELRQKGPDECCYGLYDYESPIARKLFLLLFCPESAQLAKKVLYTRGFEALKKLLVGIQKFIIASDMSDICRDSLEEKLRMVDHD